MTRFGFNVMVVVYLIPLLLIDIAGNTISTGSTSEMYLWKTIFDAALVCYAIYELFTDSGTTSASAASRRVDNHTDTVIGFEKIAGIEYVYCLFLAVYAAINAYLLHGINHDSAGITSIASLIWFVLSLGVTVLAAVRTVAHIEGRNSE